MIVSLFVGIYVARYLGPERFGLLSYANSFVGLFTAIATLGLDGIVVRELVKLPGQRDKLLGTSFLLKVAGSLVMWLMILIAIFFSTLALCLPPKKTKKKFFKFGESMPQSCDEN